MRIFKKKLDSNLINSRQDTALVSRNLDDIRKTFDFLDSPTLNTEKQRENFVCLERMSELAEGNSLGKNLEVFLKNILVVWNCYN